MSKTIFYFAYGSNLLSKRIHINNPKATRKDIGRLENYRIDFVGYGNKWKGAPATIMPHDGSHTWGAIWELPEDEIKHLDHQEGVHKGEYVVLNVDIINPIGNVYSCRTYQQSRVIDKYFTLPELPEERRPSLIYLKTIIKGALESELPNDYVQMLKIIKHNGYTCENIIGKEVCDFSFD